MRTHAWRSVLACLGLAGAAAMARAADNCHYKAPPASLPVRAGYAAFLTDDQLRPFMAHMPHVSEASVEAALTSPETMWYDEASMVYAYQDSTEFVVGLRANCVGRVIGELSRNHPQVGKLLKLFGEDQRFLFPFRTAAGTDDSPGVHVLNFWRPPHDGTGAALPVRWWKESARGRWRWVFPVGTMLGEVLFQTAPDGALYPFEVRTRERYADGWRVQAFRPFLTAANLAGAVMRLRPQWEEEPHLRALVAHLGNPDSLVTHRLEAGAYAPAFPPLTGALDPLPDFGDPALVKELLTGYVFQAAEGRIWKENGRAETYAPGSAGGFGIVPKDYRMGLIPVNEDSCNRCHADAGRPLGQFIPDVAAYGEVWGEDRIFTWHPFEPSENIFGPYDDNQQGSRKISSRLTRAGLLRQGRPDANDPLYRELPRPRGATP